MIFSGANQCYTQAKTGKDDFNWLFQATAPVATGDVADCCTRQTDPNTGAHYDQCDISKGCGWTTDAHPGQLKDQCSFTENARPNEQIYPTLAACTKEHPAPGPDPTPAAGRKWFKECKDGAITNCYFPETGRGLDKCVQEVFQDPSFFAAKGGVVSPAMAMQHKHAQQCPYYICSTDTYQGYGGRRSFAAPSCRCAPQDTIAELQKVFASSPHT
jgi:hypothetical protein